MNLEDPIEIFCWNVKFLRRKRGMTKKAMANVLGISVRMLNTIEDGKLPPRLDCSVFDHIQEAFGFGPHTMFAVQMGE